MIASEQKEIDGIIYHIIRWTDEKHFFKKITIEEMLFGKSLEYTEQVRKFNADELCHLFSRNGLNVKQVYGDYLLNEYDPESSPRLVLIAEKG